MWPQWLTRLSACLRGVPPLLPLPMTPKEQFDCMDDQICELRVRVEHVERDERELAAQLEALQAEMGTASEFR